MTEVEVIQGVIDRLKDPAHWIKGLRALTAEGYQTSPLSDKAAMWCLGGAVMNVLQKEYWTGWFGTDPIGRRFHALASARGYEDNLSPFVAFNNASATTHEDLMLFLKEALFDAEIQELRSGPIIISNADDVTYQIHLDDFFSRRKSAVIKAGDAQ